MISHILLTVKSQSQIGRRTTTFKFNDKRKRPKQVGKQDEW